MSIYDEIAPAVSLQPLSRIDADIVVLQSIKVVGARALLARRAVVFVVMVVVVVVEGERERSKIRRVL